jgi:hypothetical protein
MILDDVTTMLDRCHSALQALAQLAPSAISSTPGAASALLSATLSASSFRAGAAAFATVKGLLAAAEPGALPALLALFTDAAVARVMAGATKATSKDSECRAAAVGVLAALCAAPHAEAAARSVTGFLLGALAEDPSVMVADEVLNALMDIYGSDHAHRKVYDELGVGAAVEGVLPGFKKRGKDVRGEEQMQIKETALNLKRFLKFMKG